MIAYSDVFSVRKHTNFVPQSKKKQFPPANCWFLDPLRLIQNFWSSVQATGNEAQEQFTPMAISQSHLVGGFNPSSK